VTLDELEREGHIKRLPADKKKVEDAFNLAKRDIKVAKSVLREDVDWAYSIAYNAMLQAIRALMFSKGYRVGISIFPWSGLQNCFLKKKMSLFWIGCAERGTLQYMTLREQFQ